MPPRPIAANRMSWKPSWASVVRWTGDHPLATTARVKATELYTQYVDWCKEAGEKNVLTKRRFGSAMTEQKPPARGIERCFVETRSEAEFDAILLV